MVVTTNESLFDVWSLGHFGMGTLLSLWKGPFVSFGAMVAFEGIEALGQKLQFQPPEFFNESPRNRWVGDVISDGLGAIAGWGIKKLMKK